MHILTFLSRAMFGGIVTLFLHCCLIVGKEKEIPWEEEQTMKNAKKQEK